MTEIPKKSLFYPPPAPAEVKTLFHGTTALFTEERIVARRAYDNHDDKKLIFASSDIRQAYMYALTPWAGPPDGPILAGYLGDNNEAPYIVMRNRRFLDAALPRRVYVFSRDGFTEAYPDPHLSTQWFREESLEETDFHAIIDVEGPRDVMAQGAQIFVLNQPVEDDEKFYESFQGTAAGFAEAVRSGLMSWENQQENTGVWPGLQQLLAPPSRKPPRLSSPSP